ncbi:MAG: dehydrogenase [Myxococcaceae bacterium]|nr:dehydrogenase [Myxococcaceae bacterium]
MRVVIVGAGYAGLSCALRLAGRSRGAAAITLVNAHSEFVQRIRLHEHAVARPQPALPLTELLRGTSVALELGSASKLDLRAQTLRVGERTIGWDKLVLALGSQDDLDRVRGAREHAHALDAASLPRLASKLAGLARRAEHVVVVGGGLTGVETACELAESYATLQVTLITRGEVLDAMSAPARDYVRRVLARLGVALREHVSVQEVRAGSLQTQHESIPYAACLWTAGFVAPALARLAGLPVNTAGQVWVDQQLRALGHPDVHVVGDLARPAQDLGDPMPMGCKAAFPTGLYVADSIARTLVRAPARPFRYRAVPFCVSLGRHDAVLQKPCRTGAPPPRFLRGKLATWIKEWICLATVQVLKVERVRAAFSLRWTQTLRLRRAHALPTSK